MDDQNLFGTCPYFTAQKIFSGKWSILIIHNLNNGPLRHGELRRKLNNITQATLTKQLRSLEEFGLIRRHVYSEVPPKVEYSLTDLGKSFDPVLEQLKLWGENYIKYLEASID